MGVMKTHYHDQNWPELKQLNFDNINYFSTEHENLIKSGIEIFKEKTNWI